MLFVNQLVGFGAKRAVSTWVPTDLGTDLVAWYDAQDGASITESSGAVSQWNDKSGHAYHLTQTVAGAKPTYSATGFNSTYPGITGDGGDSLNRAAASSYAELSGLSTLTVWIAAQMTTSGSAAFSGLCSILSQADNADYDQVSGIVCVLRNSNTEAAYTYQASTPCTSQSVTYGSYRRFACVSTGSANTTLYVDNGANPGSRLASPTFDAQNKMTVLARWDNSSGGATSTPWVGCIGEVIVSKAAADATLRTTVDGYLAARWGL
jgi:hypothetical protein